MQIYCWATVVCLAVLLLALLASRGALLHRFFFYDVTDTGMDFFHSIEYTRGRMPYGQFDTLYPPLANLFFYVLYLLVPKTQSATWTESFISSLNMKGTERDLRLQQATMMLFIVFVIVVVLGIVSMTERLTRSCGGRKELLAFCAVFSYGVLYGLERGNILLLCWPLMAFFILYRNSENPLLRELACLALAIAAGFKLYPAFLGVLLLRDKNYLAAVRTVLYGVVCLCFPLFFFNEGLFGLTLWFRVLFDFSGSRGEPWIGNGFSNILAEAGHAVDKLLGAEHIYILGVRSSSFLAGYLNFYLHLIFKNVTLVQSSAAGEIYEQLAHIGRGDVLVGISFPRYSKMAIHAVEFACRRGAEVVAITDSALSPLYGMAAVSLLAPCDMISFVDSMAAPLSLLNALILAVGQQRRDDLSATLADMEQVWSRYSIFGKDDE